MSGNFNVVFSLEAQDHFSSSYAKAIQKNEELKMSLKQSEVATVNLERKTAQLKSTNESSFGSIKKNNKDLQESFSALGTKISSIGSSLKSLALGYLSFAGMKRGFESFAYFDKYIQKTGIVAHLSQEQIKDLKQELIEVSKLQGVDLNPLASASRILASAGLKDVKEIGKFLTVASQIVRTAGEELNIEDVAQLLGVMKANFPTLEASELGDTIAWMLEKLPNITFHELQTSLSRSAPLAKQLGVSLQEVMSVEASDIINKSGAQASTSMEAVLRVLDSKKEEIAKRLKIDNIDLADEGLIKLLRNVDEKFKDISRDDRVNDIKKIFGDNKLANDINDYLDGVKNIQKTYKELTVDAKGFAEASAKKLDFTDYVKLKQIMSEVGHTFLLIGEIVSKLKIPDAFLSAINVINKVLQAFASPEVSQKDMAISSRVVSEQQKSLRQGKTLDSKELDLLKQKYSEEYDKEAEMKQKAGGVFDQLKKAFSFSPKSPTGNLIETRQPVMEAITPTINSIIGTPQVNPALEQKQEIVITLNNETATPMNIKTNISRQENSTIEIKKVNRGNR
jgi:TP901 family phage tail tape measure protein